MSNAALRSSKTSNETQPWSGFCHFGLVYSWFFDRALTVLFSGERAALSMRFALLSTCSVSCWSVVFRSRHSCLVSGSVLVLCRGSDTHVSRVRAGRVLLCPCAFVVFVFFLLFCLGLCGTPSCVFHWLRVFMFVMNE